MINSNLDPILQRLATIAQKVRLTKVNDILAENKLTCSDITLLSNALLRTVIAIRAECHGLIIFYALKYCMRNYRHYSIV